MANKKLIKRKGIAELDNSGVDFVQRLNQGMDRQYISDWEHPNSVATHKLGYAEFDDGVAIYPEVQNINGTLIDFTRPPYRKNAGLQNALERKDVVWVDSPGLADSITRNYKNYYDFNYK